MVSIRELTDEHIELIDPLPPKVRGLERVHLKEMLNGIIQVLWTGCRWADMPSQYGNHEIAYNMFRRYSLNRVWARATACLISRDLEEEAATADSATVKARRTSMSMAAGIEKEPGHRKN